MEYRQSRHSGMIYRRRNGTNEVLTFWGWKACTFSVGDSGWRDIVCISVPVAVNPGWPA